MIGRRGFITGLISLVAAPAIVRAGSLMPVKMVIEPYGIRPMMAARLHFAEMLVNPPSMDLFDFDAVMHDIFRITGIPAQWIQDR